MVVPYGASCIQCVTRVVTDAATKDRVIKENLARDLELIDYVCEEPRYRSRLVLFPEFFLTSVPESRRAEDYMMRSIEIPGEVTETLGQKARQHGIYISGAAFEIDRDWPGRCFNTAFIIDPQGQVILKYRKLNDTQAYMPTSTNPGDVLSAYIERYGEDALFPVVDTEIGRLACMTCYDVNFPEVARILAWRGAEVICVPTGEGYTFNRYQEHMRQARAYENSVYIVCTNHGRFLGGTRPEEQQRGRSQIVDYHGNIQECADGPGELTITAMIDIEALRQKRARVDFYNFQVGLRASLYARFYQKMDCWPEDHWAQTPIRSNEEAVALGRAVLEKLYAQGVLKRAEIGVPEPTPRRQLAV